MVIINIECAMKQEFLNYWNSEFWNSRDHDCDVTYALPARSYTTRFYPRTHPTHIYVSHVIQILKNPPEYTMRNRVQSGRNTKNITHAHLLGIA